MIVPSAEQIRQRLAKRRAPLIGRCASCGHEQESAFGLPMASSMASEQGVCQKCRGQIYHTFTIGGDEPSADEDVQELLTLLDTLSQEVERLKQENAEPLTRTGEPVALPSERATAPTDKGNMFGLTACPKCGSEYRWPTKQNTIQCDDCGLVEQTK